MRTCEVPLLPISVLDDYQAQCREEAEVLHLLKYGDLQTKVLVITDSILYS